MRNLDKMELNFKIATEKDVPEIVAMIADDELGKTRENYMIPLPGD
jgi:hypothetical protein